MFELMVFLTLFCVGYFSGTYFEKKHFKELKRWEERTLRMPAVTFAKSMEIQTQVLSSKLVTGSAVISIDYFKRILASLRNLFGGEMGTYQSLLDRARREAVLRMKKSVPAADIIVNVRIETSTVGSIANRKGNMGSVEALAYGTAIFLEHRKS